MDSIVNTVLQQRSNYSRLCMGSLYRLLAWKYCKIDQHLRSQQFELDQNLRFRICSSFSERL